MRSQRGSSHDDGASPREQSGGRARATGDAAARAAALRHDLRRRLRGTSGRGRKLRGLVVLLGPYRGRVALMFAALVAGTAASLAPAPLAKTAIDSGILKGDKTTLDLVVVAFVASALVVWGANDDVDPVASGRQGARDLRARFVLIPNAGHLSMLVAPTAVARAISLR